MKYKRRIYIDLGVKDFESRVCWMMQNYPLKFDLVYGFECADDLSNLTTISKSIGKCLHGMTGTQTNGYTFDEFVQTFKF